MDPGAFGHYATIQEPATTGQRDAIGQAKRTYTTFGTTWGKREDLAGQELTDARQVNARASVRWTIRYQEGINTDMRLVEGSRTFEILAVLDREGRNRYLELLCVEVR